ncbi:alkaline phosphatase family protein [Bacillus solitudinis]|uniref:alkaline phosphatase family protein n=1 Tax=Bacillus solitudinis TaxID=2014074 RepID=UPI000C23F344|nr:alkaline phosphatase family protein [Bacillus solitudinis]
MKQWILFLFVCFFLVACQDKQPEGASLQGGHPSSIQKNVIAIIIDSMTDDLVQSAQVEGKIPALSYLMKQGHYVPDFIAPFPTMSVVIESTLMTGAEPNVHQIPGIVWYKEDENRLINYGSTIPGMWKLGMGDSLTNTIYHLNNTHLSDDTVTIFEKLHEKGHTTGAVNTLIYRGPTDHIITIPFSAHRVLGDKVYKTKGPDILSLGQAVKPKVIQNKTLSDTLYQRYGFHDKYSTEVVEQLISSKEQPQFLMVFLPDLDKKIHNEGPDYVEGLGEADYFLQKILNSYDNWEKALDENIFIVFGDHGQDKILADKNEAAIEVEPLLEPYTIAPLLDEPTSADFFIANNHRMMYLYQGLIDRPWKELLPSILSDTRLDHIAYLDGDEMVITNSQLNQEIRVKKDGNWIDEFGESWQLHGDVSLVDVELNHTKQQIYYGQYPNVFKQFYHALHSHSRPLIVTAKPGHVLKSEASPVYTGGGEHGGLHINDTNTAMIIAGTDKLPADRRMESFKAYILSLFNIGE